MTLLCFIYKASFFRSFIFSSWLVYLPLLCPYLTSSPVLYSLSHFELLSLSSCHRGKQNTVAMETAHREERGSLWGFQCGDRSLYMAISCLRAGRWVQPSTNIVSHFPVWKTTRQTERHTEWDKDRETEKGKWREREKDVWSLVWLISIIRFGRNCLVIVRPSSFLPVAQYHYS